jgi:outer membrane protein OmpA-like peptidoglycan-associated protein
MRTFFNTMQTGLCILSFLLFTTLLTTGCATIPEKNAALERARAAYNQVQANPDINANAPVALYEAGQALRKAEQTKDVAEMEHLAYLAERKSQIAAALTEQKMAENERERLIDEKEKILLGAREYEIHQIRKEAETRASEAEKAKKEAESRALEIERTKGKAEALALQAEKSKQEAEAKAMEAEKARLQTEQALAQRMQLEKEIAELKAKQTDRGIVLTLGDILFETGKADLMPGAMFTIDKLVEFLNKYPNRNVIIEGHTDSIGSETYNLGLSQRRADAVRTALLSKGISTQRIATKGYGKKYPVASNSTPAGRQQNRRVEIIILNEGASSEHMLR